MGRRVTAQLIGDQSSRDTALSFQQFPEEADGRPSIAAGLHENVDHVAVFVDGPPQILLPAPDLHEQLVQMPGVALTSPAAPQPPSIGEPECPTPLPNRFVGDRDPALGQQIFRVAEAETETMVEPDGVTDDFRGKRYPW